MQLEAPALLVLIRAIPSRPLFFFLTPKERSFLQMNIGPFSPVSHAEVGGVYRLHPLSMIRGIAQPGHSLSLASISLPQANCLHIDNRLIRSLHQCIWQFTHKSTRLQSAVQTSISTAEIVHVLCSSPFFFSTSV